MAHLVACQLSPPGRSCRLAINNDSHLKSPGLHVVHCGLCCMLVTGNVVSDRRHGCRAACWVVRNRTIREGLDWLFPCVLGDLRSDLTLSNRWIAETLCHDDRHLPTPVIIHSRDNADERLWWTSMHTIYFGVLVVVLVCTWISASPFLLFEADRQEAPLFCGLGHG